MVKKSGIKTIVFGSLFAVVSVLLIVSLIFGDYIREKIEIKENYKAMEGYFCGFT